MDKIFLVVAEYDYEGSTPVRAFATDAEAQELAARANEHQGKRPSYTAPGYEQWHDNHPAPDCAGCDRFDVEKVPFGPSVPGGETGNAGV